MRVSSFDTPARCARGLLNQRSCWSSSADAQRLRVSRPSHAQVAGSDTPCSSVAGLLNQQLLNHLLLDLQGGGTREGECLGDDGVILGDRCRTDAASHPLDIPAACL